MGTTDDQPPDIGQFSAEILTRLAAELRERFPLVDELSQRERDAVMAAIGRAAWFGILQGIALLTTEFNAKVRQIEEADPDADVTYLETHFATGASVPDPWLDKYGGEEED